MVTAATARGQSATTQCQACSKGAFAADRPAAAPAARRSCESHAEAPGATGCLAATAKRTTPAVVELMEFVLGNAEQPGPRVEKVAVAVPDAAIGLTVAIMPLTLVVLWRYYFRKN